MTLVTQLFYRQKIRLGDKLVTVYSDSDKIKATSNATRHDFLTILKTIKTDSDKLQAIQGWNFDSTTLDKEILFVEIIDTLEAELHKLKAIDTLKAKTMWDPSIALFKFLPLFKLDVCKIELLDTLMSSGQLDFKSIVAVLESLTEDTYKVEALDSLTPTSLLSQDECERLIKLIKTDTYRHQAIRRIRIIYTDCEGYKFNHLLKDAKYMLEVPIENDK